MKANEYEGTAHHERITVDEAQALADPATDVYAVPMKQLHTRRSILRRDEQPLLPLDLAVRVPTYPFDGTYEQEE